MTVELDEFRPGSPPRTPSPGPPGLGVRGPRVSAPPPAPRSEKRSRAQGAPLAVLGPPGLRLPGGHVPRLTWPALLLFHCGRCGFLLPVRPFTSARCRIALAFWRCVSAAAQACGLGRRPDSAPQHGGGPDSGPPHLPAALGWVGGSRGFAGWGRAQVVPSAAPAPVPDSYSDPGEARRACGFSASLERAGFCRPGAACLPPDPVPRFFAFRASAGFSKLRSFPRREGQGREGGRVKGVLSPGLGRLRVWVVQGPRWPPWGTFSRRRRGRWGWARLIPGSSLARTESVFTWAQPVRVARVCACSTSSDVEVTSRLTKVIGILE